MPTRDIMSHSKDEFVLATGTRTATAESSSVDTQGFDGVRFAAFLGAAGDTLSSTVYIELDVQVSDDDSTWVAADDNDIIVERSNGNTTGTAVGTANGAHNTGAAFLATASSQLTGGITVRFGYVGAHRYVRVADTRGGTQATGTASSVFAVLGYPSYNPTIGNAS